MEKVADKPLLTEVATFSARKNWDPLFGLDVGAAYREWLYLSQNATVVESMLIALNHMQVSVCYLWSRGNLCKGLRAIPGFKKNIISFPQDVADLKNLAHFFSSLGENDIVNVRQRQDDAQDSDNASTLRRARVLQLMPEGVQVEFADDEAGYCHERRVVALEDVEQRVQVPWKPRDLADNFIVFRRRIGRSDEYIEDLRVRKNFVRRILDLLMEPGFYRPDQGEQCRHMYYSSCDRVESNIEELPEDGVPTDLHFRDLDEQLPSGNVSKQMFVDWLPLGRHDCAVARALGYAWTEKLKGSGNETIGEFFDRLLIERAEEEVQARQEHDDSEDDTEAASNKKERVVTDELTVPWLAKFFMSVFEVDKVPFKMEGETGEDILLALGEKIAQELQSVEGYASTWRTSGVMGAVPTRNVEESTREQVKTHLHARPRILEEPTRERADGRFVKAFPLVFPMGVATPALRLYDAGRSAASFQVLYAAFAPRQRWQPCSLGAF